MIARHLNHASTDRVVELIERCRQLEAKITILERSVDAHRRHLQSLEQKLGKAIHDKS